jgi:hypothetical protein
MRPSDERANPCPEFGDFLGGFALGVKFRDGAAGGYRSGKGASVADRYEREGEMIRCEDFSGFPHLGCARGAGVHNEGGGLSRGLGHLHAGRHRGQIERRRATRNEQQVRRSGNHINAWSRMGSGVNDHECRLLLRGLPQEAFDRGGDRFLEGGL